MVGEMVLSSNTALNGGKLHVAAFIMLYLISTRGVADLEGGSRRAWHVKLDIQ